MNINEKKAENSPAGGVLVGKKDGQTIIHDEGTMSGYLVGKLHKDGGIKAINKSTGQALEMQGGEVVITAPAVSDQTKREFEGKMMTNREILSAINEKGGGVSFAKGGDIPKSFKTSGASYKYGGKTMKDHEILKAINGSGHLSKGKSLKQIAKMHNVSLAHINKELDKGLEVEKEHFSDFKERTRVAKDHLVENPNYYTLLKKAGLENGGAFDSKPFLNYYFEEIASFLKSQNDIVLKNDYTFFYRGEKFVIEPMILVNKDISESIKVANFNILDSDDLIVGEIDFDASNKNKFVAYSDFFEWNNIKFNNGGSINNQNNFLLNKSNRLKSFYKTNNPSIDKLLNDLQPKIEELIEKQKELVINLTLKMNGVAMPMTESDVEFYEAGLIFKMVQSFNKYLKNTDELYDVSINNRGGLFEVNGKVKRDGRTYRFDTELIGAGGYNIQEYHYRYIIKTDLPSSNENLAVENIKSKIAVLRKLKTIDEDIARHINRVKKDEEELKQGFKEYKIQGVEHKKDLSDFDIKSRQRDIKEFTNDIKKLESKKTDLLSVFQSLDKKGLGVNFGKEVKEAIGRRILVDRLRGSKYKETGNTLDFKIENRSIRGAKIDERSYESLGDINTFSFIDEGNGLCTMKAGLELRGKYTLYAEYKNLPIKEIPYKINEIFNGEFSKYLEYNNGGEVSKQNLIKHSKKENTSEMDLDSYNDIMDLQADGEVGGNNGLAFVDGGGIELPKVAYVSVENAGYSLNSLIGNKYPSYIEFVESVEYAYKQLGKKMRSFVSLNAYDENDLKLINVITDISDQKNTIKNFNPLTGNYKNLEKSLSNSRPISFKKYNWEDWFQSKVKPSTLVSKTIQKEYPEYYEFIDETNLDLDGVTRFTKNKIYKIIDPKNIEATQNFIDDRGETNGFNSDNRKKFKPSTKEAYEAQESIVTKPITKKITEEGTFEIKEGDDLTGRWLKCVKKTNWSSEKGRPKVGDYLKIVNGETTSFDNSIVVIDMKGESVNFNPVRINNEKEFQLMPEGFSPKEAKETIQSKEVIEKPIDIKPKRNFELERKYFHKRIAELSKQLDLKKPILSNEEIGFYQREINNLIFKLRKLNEEEEALIPINERLQKVFSLKFGDFDKQYIETDLTSPNGVKSELTEEQYFAVRTESFKSFFGDWMLAIETDNYNGISKIINPKTKEPLAVWHGTNVLFTSWKTYKTNNAHYFAVKKEMSEFFAKSWESRTDKAAVDSKALKTLNPNKGKYLLRCFLDIKNPIDFSRFGVEKRPVKEFLLFLKINYNIGDYDFWTKAGNMFGLAPDAKVYAWQIIRNWQAFTQYIKTFTTYDGYIFYEYIPDKEFSGLENASLSFCAFESNQIKFDNAVEFNALANDSRFNLGGKI